MSESGNILTKEVAKEFLEDLDLADRQKLLEKGDYNGFWGACDQRSVALVKYSQIEAAAAEVLAKCTEELRLNGLVSLSTEAAQALGKNRAELHLDGLASLPDGVAEGLAGQRGELHLDGLTSLSDAAARALSEHEGLLSLNGISSISDGALRELAKHKGGLLLDGLTELSDAAAEALAAHEGELSIDGLSGMSDIALKWLVKHRDPVSLHSLDDISNAAKELLNDGAGHGGRGLRLGDRKDNLHLPQLDYELWLRRQRPQDDIAHVASSEGDDDREFIVSVNFTYRDVSHDGYRIMKRSEIRDLIRGIESGGQIFAPNMPEDWEDSFDVSQLAEAFSIYSSESSHVEAMRLVFGDDVGDTTLFDEVLEETNQKHCEDNVEEYDDDEN